MGKIIEGFWDCKYCDTIGIRGGIRECPGCGKARDKNTKFYLSKNKISYVPKEKAKEINKNPDWVCNYCEQLNSDNEEYCISCGAPRTNENLNYFENHAKNTKKNYHSEDITSDLSDLSDNNYSFSNTSSKEVSFSLKNFFNAHIYHILIALLSFLVIAGVTFFLFPKTQEITIDNFSWQRSIDIERYQTVEESDWELPHGAHLLYSNVEFSHYQPVIDHYEIQTREVIIGYEDYVSGYNDLGNGYFEETISSRPVYGTETYEEPVYRNEPVYRTKYYYEIDKWIYTRTVKTEGTDHKPYWGESNLASDERISNKFENYSISGLNTKGEKIDVIISYEDWISLKTGQTVKIKVSLGYGEIVE